MHPRKILTLVKALPRPQICGNCLESVSKTNGKMRKQKELLTAPPCHIDLAMIPSLLLQPGFMCRLDSGCLLGLDRTTGETNCCIEAVTSKDILDQSAHLLCEHETSYCGTYCPPLRNTLTWPLQNLKKTCESKKFMDPKSSSATTSMTFRTQACAL